MPKPLLPLFPALGGPIQGDRLERILRSPHYHRGRFWNAAPTQKLKSGSLRSIVKEQFSGQTIRHPQLPLPVATDTKDVLAIAPESGLRATWFGHSSTLIEIDGVRVLTDPVWSKRCSPFQHIGPRRFFPPPIAIDDLPAIDVVLISHDHYDHLDYPTITLLSRTAAVFVTSLGVGAHLEVWGVEPERIIELDWGDRYVVNGIELIACQAQHFSGRRFTDENATFWSSWVLRGPRHRVYYSGDTGYFDATDIGQEYGPFDMTLMAIGAYNKNWADIHTGPEEALVMHRQVGGKLLLPVHWGTFNLAMHDWREPAVQLASIAEQFQDSIYIPKPGEPIDPHIVPPLTHWWDSSE